MKSIKIISFILALITLSGIMISCGNTDAEVVLPERSFYDIKVSFQIKDASGKTIFEAENYNYKGHEEPTILNIISDYIVIVEDARCSIDKNNTLQQVGGTKAKSGEYWAFMQGVNLDVQAILTNPSLQKKHFIEDTRMADYIVEDGGAFTIVLVKAS